MGITGTWEVYPNVSVDLDSAEAASHGYVAVIAPDWMGVDTLRTSKLYSTGISIR